MYRSRYSVERISFPLLWMWNAIWNSPGRFRGWRSGFDLGFGFLLFMDLLVDNLWISIDYYFIVGLFHCSQRFLIHFHTKPSHRSSCNAISYSTANKIIFDKDMKDQRSMIIDRSPPSPSWSLHPRVSYPHSSCCSLRTACLCAGIDGTQAGSARCGGDERCWNMVIVLIGK